MTQKKSIVLFLVLTLFSQPLFAGEKAGTKKPGLPDGSTGGLSVGDLDFTDTEIKSDPQYQKDLLARSDMLQIHHTLRLIPAVPLTPEVVLGTVSTCKEET